MKNCVPIQVSYTQVLASKFFPRKKPNEFSLLNRCYRLKIDIDKVSRRNDKFPISKV